MSIDDQSHDDDIVDINMGVTGEADDGDSLRDDSPDDGAEDDSPSEDEDEDADDASDDNDATLDNDDDDASSDDDDDDDDDASGDDDDDDRDALEKYIPGDIETNDPRPREDRDDPWIP